MYVPCGTSSLPARLCVRVLAARGLPVMDKSNVTTDAFVEVYFGNEFFKSEVCTKSLSPVWNSEEFVFETDEKCLFDCPIQFRVMDHDTYTANDAIGRVSYDANMLVAKIRSNRSTNNTTNCTTWLPIYDTLYGLRGELQVTIALTLLVSAGADYVCIYSASNIPSSLTVGDILGLVCDIETVDDPEYEWIDKIRTPRASNEARQNVIRKSLRGLARNVAQKAYSLDSNAVLGYREFVDIEGDATELLTLRAFGTAVKLVSANERVRITEKLPQQIISLPVLPDIFAFEYGVVVCARSAQILTNDSDSVIVRKKWWMELKAELSRQASGLRCNVVIDYSEQVTFEGKTIVLSCSGTAVSIIPPSEHSPPFCSAFHSTYSDVENETAAQRCSLCSKAVCPNLILGTCQLPSTEFIQGICSPIQVYITRELNSSENDDQLAYEISHLLPFLEHELYNKLIDEMRLSNSKFNSVFCIKSVLVIEEGSLFAVLSGIACTLKALSGEKNVSFAHSNSLRHVDETRSVPRVGLLDAARILRSSRISDKSSLHLHPLQMKTHDEDASQGQQRYRYMRRFMQRFRKKVVDRENFTRLIAQRKVASQLGVFDDPKSGSLAGLQLNSGFKFTITTRLSKNLVAPQRCTIVLIRETNKTMDDIGDLDDFLEAAFRDTVTITTSHVESIGANSLSQFCIPSISLSISRDQASVFLFITGDFDCSINE